MVTSYKIHELVEYIDWLYFFHAWRLGAQFGQISDIHGCDACRAQWLASFPEEDRTKAAEAMQLFKEANRMINELDKDYETLDETQDEWIDDDVQELITEDEFHERLCYSSFEES